MHVYKGERRTERGKENILVTHVKLIFLLAPIVVKFCINLNGLETELLNI